MKRIGFTLIELLVVISIIALLLAIMLPSLRKAKELARGVMCMANLKNIAPAVVMYSDENDDKVHRSPNGGLFHVFGTNDPIDPDKHGPTLPEAAYWGVKLNDTYLQDMKMFKCPSSKLVDYFVPQGVTEADKDQYQFANYGINGYYKKSGRKMSSFRSPARMVYAQDHMEHRMDNNGDTLFIKSGDPENLVQWRAGYGRLGDIPQYSGRTTPLYEVYRHSGKSNTIRLDGHVDYIKESDGSDVRSQWYVGSDDAAAKVNWPI